MVESINISTLLSIAAMVTTIGTAILTIRKIAKDMERTKRIQEAKILQAAKEADAILNTKFDNKFKELENEIVHLKEYHMSELKNLGEKIENLRTELGVQHASLLSLLTKLVGKD
jgi:hypothetical protein